ncbi:hypothetical protein KDL44_14225 [bacterium]|nr:hypothetical protein [bacterium]
MTMRGSAKFAGFPIFGLLFLAVSCNPLISSRQEQVGQSQYLVDDARLYSNDGDLGMKDILTYPKSVRKGPVNVSTGVPNRDLTIYRCTWCHECGFTRAFDYENFGTDEWNPQYVGEAWRGSVQRMNDRDETLLNEQIAERIYTYLRDVTNGTYDPDSDTRPATRIEVDDVSAIQVTPGQAVVDDGDQSAPETDGSAEGNAADPDSE